ncbi:MAG: hypothetical protein BJ554DRAFT_4383 [Olpidium bornovanus]|uniref:Uncharacterized protein n=1 Tax=Olpidium bornovanus TaxID=278681 RepID=A0A8H8DLE5_9FUNG|nr:MAG: hypothetical protein BJ554DRAFT_4383 [Olpidium bornovanus]
MRAKCDFRLGPPPGPPPPPATSIWRSEENDGRSADEAPALSLMDSTAAWNSLVLGVRPGRAHEAETRLYDVPASAAPCRAFSFNAGCSAPPPRAPGPVRAVPAFSPAFARTAKVHGRNREARPCLTIGPATHETLRLVTVAGPKGLSVGALNVCANPDDHVFWGNFHFTAAVHKVLGNSARLRCGVYLETRVFIHVPRPTDGGAGAQTASSSPATLTGKGDPGAATLAADAGAARTGEGRAGGAARPRQRASGRVRQKTPGFVFTLPRGETATPGTPGRAGTTRTSKVG